jgi:hypothetical protein
MSIFLVIFVMNLKALFGSELRIFHAVIASR